MALIFVSYSGLATLLNEHKYSQSRWLNAECNAEVTIESCNLHTVDLFENVGTVSNLAVTCVTCSCFLQLKKCKCISAFYKDTDSGHIFFLDE